MDQIVNVYRKVNTKKIRRTSVIWGGKFNCLWSLTPPDTADELSANSWSYVTEL